MKGAAKSKVVTSGRLTGRVKAQPSRKRVTPNPRPAACPEPAYSLYSTDSEDQVTSLHKGLDRCAALLNGILQAETTALPSLPRAMKDGAAKSRPSTSLGKKTFKKLPAQTDQKSCQGFRRGLDSRTPRTTHRSPVPAAHSGVKLHPPRKQPHTPLHSHLSPSRCQTLQHPSLATPPPQPQPSIPPAQASIPPAQASIPPAQASIPHSDLLLLPQSDCQSASDCNCKAERDREEEEEEEFVPVRDIDSTDTAVTHSRMHTCALKMPNMPPEPGQVDEVPQDTYSEEQRSAETELTVKTVQYLLGELKALIAGQGSVAERLLSHLEQAVSSPLISVGGSNVHTEPDLSSLNSQEPQLHRRVRILQQQQNMEILCNREVSALQEELTTAQVRLQELQGDLAELRKAHEDTRSQLRDREAKNALIMTDLEVTRSRLLDSEREKSELASLAQQRLEEIEHLKRTLQSQNSSDCPTLVGSSVSDSPLMKQHSDQHQHRQDASELTSDLITHYLMSLGQPTHTEHLSLAAEREENTPGPKKLTSVQLRDTLSHPDVGLQRGDKQAAHHRHSKFNQSHCLDKVQSCGRLLNSTHCDLESVRSDWSMSSGATFDTRDEAAFRDGLSALDASIASLQKTIQLDLGR